MPLTRVYGNLISSGTITGDSIAANVSLTGTIEVKGTSAQSGEIRIFEDTDNGTNRVTLKANNSIASNVIFVLPNTDGTANQVLITDGTGNLSFATASGGVTKGQAIAFSSIFGL